MHDATPYDLVSCKQRHQYPFINKFVIFLSIVCKEIAFKMNLQHFHAF